MTLDNASTKAGEDTLASEQTEQEASRFERKGQPAPERGAAGRRVTLRGLKAYYGDAEAIKGVDLAYEPNKVTAMIGPSGCGKSTMVRCINRMHEEIPHARAEGEVKLDELDIYGDNVAAGVRLSGHKSGDMKQTVERSLRGAGLWDEVKDRLNEPGIGLSGGQQQRLCIARTIAVEPEVIIMDEPCSALDPVATLKIEELISELKQRYTIILVTHNMQQAGRVADTTAFMLTGELVEVDETEKIFTNPSDKRTEDYVSGKFG